MVQESDASTGVLCSSMSCPYKHIPASRRNASLHYENDGRFCVCYLQRIDVRRMSVRYIGNIEKNEQSFFHIEVCSTLRLILQVLPLDLKSDVSLMLLHGDLEQKAKRSIRNNVKFTLSPIKVDTQRQRFSHLEPIFPCISASRHCAIGNVVESGHNAYISTNNDRSSRDDCSFEHIGCFCHIWTKYLAWTEIV